MAQAVFRKEMISKGPKKISVGKHLLDILTTGMYSDPLMVLREYVQNATDSIEVAIRRKKLLPEDARIDIVVDGAYRTLSVEDNGNGIIFSDVEALLCNIGESEKAGQDLRGFRGIGRLGGLGYCERLEFLTRSNSKEPITRVSWNGELLRSHLLNKDERESITQLLSKCVNIDYDKPNNETPVSFFKVVMYGVYAFHKDELCNPNSIDRYLSRVAPVPYNPKMFKFTNRIEDHINGFGGYLSLNIMLNGEPLYRPYRNSFNIRKGLVDTIQDIELIESTNSDGTCILKGWFAKTQYLASLPIDETMRGLSVRQGNIEVGNHFFLSEYFTESRFATWHIGELHVSYALKPNARRDGFESTPAYERFLEYSTLLCGSLSKACRSSSKIRCSQSISESKLQNIENRISEPIFVNEDQYLLFRENALTTLINIEENIGVINQNNEFVSRILNAKQKLTSGEFSPIYLNRALDGRKLKRKNPINLLKDLSISIAQEYASASNAEELLKKVLFPYMKGFGAS